MRGPGSGRREEREQHGRERGPEQISKALIGSTPPRSVRGIHECRKEQKRVQELLGEQFHDAGEPIRSAAGTLADDKLYHGPVMGGVPVEHGEKEDGGDPRREVRFRSPKPPTPIEEQKDQHPGRKEHHVELTEQA